MESTERRHAARECYQVQALQNALAATVYILAHNLIDNYSVWHMDSQCSSMSAVK